MGKVLKVNVAVQENPPYGAIKFFQAGDSLPEEFAGQVGDHVYEDPKDATLVSTTEKSGLPSAPAKKVEEQADEVEVPKKTAAVATIKKFAAAVGVDVPRNASREDAIAIIEEAIPDIEWAE